MHPPASLYSVHRCGPLETCSEGWGRGGLEIGPLPGCASGVTDTGCGSVCAGGCGAGVCV